LPAGMFFLVLWMIVSFFLIVTTMDSSSYTLAAATVNALGTQDDPPVKLRIFWAVMVTITPLCLFYMNSPITGFQSVIIITSIPISFVLIIILVSLTKWMYEDFGDKSRAEIIEEFRLPDNKPKLKNAAPALSE